jgi:hypothetical protein
MDWTTLTSDQQLKLTAEECSALLADVSSPPALPLTWFALSASEWASLTADQDSILPADLPPPQPWTPLIAPFSYSPVFSVFTTPTNGSLNRKILRAGHFLNPPRYFGPVTVTLSSCFINSEIRYTLDGTEPTALSCKYHGSLTFSSNTTSSSLTQLKAKIFSILDPRTSGPSILLEFNVI